MRLLRKYEWFGELYMNDPASRQAIDEAFSAFDVNPEIKNRAVTCGYYLIPAFMGMGSGIPGKCYQHFMKRFSELDKNDPYDNGLTFLNVTRIEFEKSRRGTAIQMKLIQETVEIPYRIIGVVAIENTKDGYKINKGWPVNTPMP